MARIQEFLHGLHGLTPGERQRVAWTLRALENVEPAPDEERIAEAAPEAISPIRGTMSPEEYLEFEATSNGKHEYVAGEVFAMTGASEPHNVITLNVASALRNHVRGGPCRVYVSDLKVRLHVGDEEFFYYPDVMVACRDIGEDKYFHRYPSLIVEVLSPTTRSIDLREKLLHYKRVPTLEEYVVIEQDQRAVRVYQRRNAWRPRIVRGLAAAVEFLSVQFAMTLEQIYEGVNLPSSQATNFC